VPITHPEMEVKTVMELNNIVKEGFRKKLEKELFKARKELTRISAETRKRLKSDGHKTLELEFASSTPDIYLSNSIPMAIQKIKEINEAIGKLETGEFGICEECEEAIPLPRLNENPHAKHCRDCQTAIEEKEKRINKCRGHVKGNGLAYV
jgi:RNA polymerase-binding transcription factor DksA